MTRKRIKHKKIPNDIQRNSVYGKRIEVFLKKASELSTLCSVDVAIVVHKQGGKNNVIIWPSPPIFRDRMEKFLEFSNMKRNKKLITHDKFMEQGTSSETESLLNFRKRIVDTESHQLMTELTQGKYLKDLDWYQLHCFNLLADEVIKKVEKRENEITEEELKTGQPRLVLLPLQPPSISSEPAVVVTAEHQETVAGEASATTAPAESLPENLRNDKWFTETMSEEHGFIKFFEALLPSNDGGAASGVNAPANTSNDFVA